jgi:myosin I
VKTIKDAKLPQQPPGEVLYKSGTIHANEGESPNSVSKPTPRPRPVAGRPITKGKLLRPGGPGGGPTKLASRPAAQSRPAGGSSRVVPKPQTGLNGSAQGMDGPAGMRAPPPPPPASGPASQDPMCRAMWDFAGQSKGEMSIKKGETVIIVRKETNGRCLIWAGDDSDSLTRDAQDGGWPVRRVARRKTRRFKGGCRRHTWRKFPFRPRRLLPHHRLRRGLCLPRQPPPMG